MRCVLIRGKRRYPDEEKAIGRLVDLYGFELDTVDVASADAIDRAMSRLGSEDTLAVIASQDALPGFNPKLVQTALERPEGRRISMLVFGVSARPDRDELTVWSGGTIRGCVPLPDTFRPKVLEVQKSGPLARTVAGLEFPAAASPACCMQLEPASAAETVLAVRGDDGTSAAALVRVQSKTGEVFFVPEMKASDRSWHDNHRDLPRVFSSHAPFILYLAYAAGDYGWHSDGHYANLTIDDAWLTQRYGHLDYSALLKEMQKHNFHTTIAFIPWNFDRSTTDAVALFNAHPERFSICVHGNNHAHREFGSYDDNSLPEQTANIKQGIARMERFSALTGILYDRFMVFPHNVAPEGTLAALKAHDFLGTANLRNVPLGADRPVDSAFLLRPYTVAYANLLSLSRCFVEGNIPRLEIAIQSFFGNPQLFFGHEGLFNTGIDTFSGIADLINHVQPDTQWTSLGEIARHSHLVRRRGDGAWDVWMLSNEMDLTNPTDEDAVFYIRKDEDIATPIPSITVDGGPVAFKRSAQTLDLTLAIPAHQVREVRVLSQNDFDPTCVDIRKSDVRARVLRLVSDFRDLYLSRFSVGRKLTRAYYRHGMYSVELYFERKWSAAMTHIGLAVGGLWRAKR